MADIPAYGKTPLFLQTTLRYQASSIEETSSTPGLGWGLETGWLLRLGRENRNNS